MTISSLRQAIKDRASEIRVSSLIAVGVAHHKKGWKDCPCSWCQKKREATVVIGGHVPKFMRGCYVEDIRDAWRDEKRVQFRAALKALEDQ